MSYDLSRFAINQITTPKWTMRQALEGYKRQGISGIAVWRQYLEEYGVAQTRKHLEQLEMWVPSLCTSEWFNVGVDKSMTTAIDTNRRLLDAAAEIGAACLMMVVGGMPPGSKDIQGQRARVREALFTLLPHAREVGVKLGLEPLHPMYAGDRSVLNSITVANDLCDELGEGVGLVPDVYHCWWDPAFEAQIRRAGRERIITFHYCDWLVPTRNFRDRGMVGDGVIDIPRVKGWLDDIGYEGPFELEIFSELDWWERPPEETVRVAIERCGPHVGTVPFGQP
ncbi:MAG TPA: sugar phosphate isomerase/epimerase family protein [Paraburkholderia sp.]|jgi:sugar phosphate isomerase/epimerase|uniref:sugar phosphate isomerase/epimerase family protein n=1 Tax=Paraburkholderia sp. TaxID=1926495 RepID=UPI002B470D2A|nr:sugar phosphate isomerase/epimerase family protein [Paraburkholderia sp.]HKR47928.1 sugar phosphate isomerase/epimerase family protein [Paraburkholderia sp.]